MKIESSKNLVELYTFFRDNVYSPQSVFYPSCGIDASAAVVFPNVTFLDIDAKAVDALKSAGHNAICLDVREYSSSEKHDLLILQNPATPADWSTPHLNNLGHAISNNYHGTAHRLSKMPEFRLIGGLNMDEGKVLLERNLEGYFEDVADVAEFKRLRPEAYEFEIGMTERFARDGMIDCRPDDSLDVKFKVYLDSLNLRMPAKKVADQYIFQKK